MTFENPTVEDAFAAVFEALYWDLHRESRPSLFAWMDAMKRPRLWQFRRMRQHRRVAAVFAKHGFILTPAAVRAFYQTEPQRRNEDVGGACIRMLRQAFQGQTGVPYHG